MFNRIIPAILLANFALSSFAGETHNSQAKAKHVVGKPSKAVTLSWLNEMNYEIPKHPKNSELYATRANCYVQLGKYQKAYDDYNTAIRLDPKRSSTYISRAGLLEGSKHPEKAMEDYDQAVKLSPKHFRAFECRGDALVRKHRLKEALVDYEQALHLIPESIRPSVEKSLNHRIRLVNEYLDKQK